MLRFHCIPSCPFVSGPLAERYYRALVHNRGRLGLGIKGIRVGTPAPEWWQGNATKTGRAGDGKRGLSEEDWARLEGLLLGGAGKLAYETWLLQARWKRCGSKH